MLVVKRFLWTIATGGLLGAIVFAWISPSVIEWYWTPPAELVLSCKPAVQWTMDAYRKVIFSGMLMGVISAGILFFAFGAKEKKPVVADHSR